jgi:RNA polymerase sigma-70 factor (ECF subfamily)
MYIRAMFNPGEVADLPLVQSILSVQVDQKPAPMTLGDKVDSLYQELRMPVFRFLLRKTQDAGHAEDLTQETFLRLCRHIQQHRPIENPKAWLFTVANNLVIDKNRSESHAQDVDEITWKQIERSRACLETNQENVVLQQERMDRLQVAVLNLTPFQRQCLHLRAEGMRYREIAELLDVSISTIVDAVRRAALKLARDLGAEAST